MSAALEARVAELERLVARLVAERRRPTHRNDLTEAQRAAIHAVSAHTGVAWSELLAQGRGPAATGKARLIMYEVLVQAADMTEAQVARLVGRGVDAVRKGRARIDRHQPDCTDPDWCDCTTPEMDAAGEIIMRLDDPDYEGSESAPSPHLVRN